jgi:chorismate mutase
VADPGVDPTIRRLRDEIAAADRAVLDAVNRRLDLVAELRRHKAEHGIEFVDSEQERRLLDRLVEANDGPLSNEAVRELFARLLELTKREVGRMG